MNWTTTSTWIAYENPWMRVREDRFLRPDGSAGLYGVVEKPDFALVIPETADGFYMVEQYRYPVRGRYLEFPQGSQEGEADIDPVELARAELAEETGLRAGAMELLGHLFDAYGFSSQGFNVFLATALEQGERSPGPEEGDLAVEFVPFGDFERLVGEGRIKDAPSLAALALRRLRQSRA
jgi:8-oxo-dGTP pyrophosphatase MutT (NUDIX family)